VSRNFVTILGIPIDDVTLPEAIDRIVGMAGGNDQHHILTPNPEMLVAAQKDPTFCTVLQTSVLNLADGAGLLLAARFLGKPLRARVPGVDTVTALCARTEIGSVFLLGAAPGVAERAAEVLHRKHPALRIAGTYAGSPGPHDEDTIVRRVNASQARFLFVAFGAPAQDLWIARNLQRMPGVRVAMGVGGSFDFLAEVRSRAPKVLRAIGMEWLWRLIHEPARFGRIVTAVIVFPFMVLLRGRSSTAVPAVFKRTRSG
jgi:N-acetylglucosaminyldiphosphoundecaprenol N-acetyl-beta-D-mannosaminyltransferase